MLVLARKRNQSFVTLHSRCGRYSGDPFEKFTSNLGRL
jgi:hypothetical protein